MHTSYYSATIPERRECRKNEARIVNRGSQGRGFESHERTFAFFILNLAIMCCNGVLLLPCSYSVSVGIYSIVMWQIFIDWGLVISLQKYSSWQKEELYLKKTKKNIISPLRSTLQRFILAQSKIRKGTVRLKLDNKIEILQGPFCCSMK